MRTSRSHLKYFNLILPQHDEYWILAGY